MNTLLEMFLGAAPNSSNAYDRRRFIAYAYECAKEHKQIDTATMRMLGVEETKIVEYENVYSWVRDIYDYLLEEGKLSS